MVCFERMAPFDNDKSNDRDLVQAGYYFALSLTHHPEEADDVVQLSGIREERAIALAGVSLQGDQKFAL